MKINRNSQNGFVLAATLWLTVVVLILAGAFNNFATRQLEFAQEIKQKRLLELDILSTEQTLLYGIATHRFTVAGLSLKKENASSFTNDEGLISSGAVGGEVRLDGSIYQGIGEAYFTLNDYVGLLSLNSGTNLHLSRVLALHEPDSSVRQGLLAALDDYKDRDNFIRLGGAEKRDYLSRNLEPPTNRNLRAVGELRKVLGWDVWLDNHPEFDFESWSSTNWQSPINPNTMPVELFESLPSMTDAIAKELIEVRKTSPFRSTEDLVRKSNGFIPLDENYYRFFPASQVRIQTFSNINEKLRTMVVEFTPFDSSRPWILESRYTRERNFDIVEPVAQFEAGDFWRELSADSDEDIFSERK